VHNAADAAVLEEDAGASIPGAADAGQGALLTISPASFDLVG
jgi:hypothetical protein